MPLSLRETTASRMPKRPGSATDPYSARKRLALLAAEHEYPEEEGCPELGPEAEGELWHAVGEAELEAQGEVGRKQRVLKVGAGVQELQSAFGLSAVEMSDDFEFAQSLGAEEASCLPTAQSPPAKKVVARNRLPKDFSEGFFSRLRSFVPDFLDVRTDVKGQAKICRIDYSPLNVEERKTFTAQLVELEESDKSVRSLVFENNKATLTAGLNQRDLL